MNTRSGTGAGGLTMRSGTRSSCSTVSVDPVIWVSVDCTGSGGVVLMYGFIMNFTIHGNSLIVCSIEQLTSS